MYDPSQMNSQQEKITVNEPIQEINVLLDPNDIALQEQEKQRIDEEISKKTEYMNKFNGNFTPFVDQQLLKVGAPPACVGKRKAQPKIVSFAQMTRADVLVNNSDQQRNALKLNLLQNCQLDLQQKNLTKDFFETIKNISLYARWDPMKDGYSGGVMLYKDAMKSINEYLEKYKNQPTEASHFEVINLYLTYFNLNMNGYLVFNKDVDKELDCTKTNPEFNDTIKNKSPYWESVKDSPLFPHEPSIHDIEQGQLGDCYLLASLSCIVNKNPQKIKECMCDNGDGTVTVRFFSNDKDSNDEFNPVYVTVTKEIPKVLDGKDPYAQNCLWAQMIEKAYACSGLHEDITEEQKNKPSYANIGGGFAGYFLKRMTGEKLETINLNEDFDLKLSQFEIANKLFEKSKKIESRIALILWTMATDENPNLLPTIEDLIEYFDNKKGFTECIDLLNEMRKADKKDNLKSKESDKDLKKDSESISEEGVNEVFDENIVNEMKKYTPEGISIQNQKFNMMNGFANIEGLNFKPFSGLYTPKTVDLYNQILEKTNNHDSFITAGTKYPEMDNGLDERHAYSVLGCKQIGDYKFVTLRNPHSSNEMTYEKRTNSKKVSTYEVKKQDNPKAIRETFGVFLIELNDFVRYFKHVDFN